MLEIEIEIDQLTLPLNRDPHLEIHIKCSGLNEGVLFPYIFTVWGYFRKKYG